MHAMIRHPRTGSFKSHALPDSLPSCASKESFLLPQQAQLTTQILPCAQKLSCFLQTQAHHQQAQARGL